MFYLFEFHDRIFNVCNLGKNLSLSIAKVENKSLTESYVSHFLLTTTHFVLLYILMHWSCPINLQYLYNTKNNLLHDFKYCVPPGSKLPYKWKIYLAFTPVASPCGSWYCPLCNLQITWMMHTLLNIAQLCWCPEEYFSQIHSINVKRLGKTRGETERKSHTDFAECKWKFRLCLTSISEVSFRPALEGTLCSQECFPLHSC